MLWTWQYRQMDKEMKLWCGETAGRRHAVERVSSRQPSSGPAMQTWSPWTTGPDRHVTPAVSGAQHCRQTVVRPHQADRDRWCRPGECAAERGERVASGAAACSGVERAACGASDRRAAATPSVTPSGWTPRRCSQRTTRRRPGRHGATRAPARSGRATPPRASAEHGAVGAAAEQQRSHR